MSWKLQNLMARHFQEKTLIKLKYVREEYLLNVFEIRNSVLLMRRKKSILL